MPDRAALVLDLRRAVADFRRLADLHGASPDASVARFAFEPGGESRPGAARVRACARALGVESLDDCDSLPGVLESRRPL